MVTSFIHAADLHLGAPLLALSRSLAPERAEQFRSLARRALDNLVDAAIRNTVDFVVIAGDVFDNAEREIALLDRFDAAMRTLADADIGVYVVLGNHDPQQRFFRPLRPLPPNVVIFGSDGPESIDHRCGNGEIIEVVGMSYGSRSESRNLVDAIASVSGRRSDVATVGVVHANVGSSGFHANYAPCGVSDLVASNVDYWALGHVHRRSVSALDDGRWWAYPGNVQGRCLTTHECGAKGALIVRRAGEWSDAVGAGSGFGGGFAMPHFIRLGDLSFEQIVVDATGCDDDGDVFSTVFRGVGDVVERCEAVACCVSVRIDASGATADRLEMMASDGSLLAEARFACRLIADDFEIAAVDVRRVGERHARIDSGRTDAGLATDPGDGRIGGLPDGFFAEVEAALAMLVGGHGDDAKTDGTDGSDGSGVPALLHPGVRSLIPAACGALGSSNLEGMSGVPLDLLHDALAVIRSAIRQQDGARK